MNVLDVQIGGNHYKSMKIQPIIFITENNLSFLQGNAIKYICRYNTKNVKKDDKIFDLEKAKHYIDLMIALIPENNIT